MSAIDIDRMNAFLDEANAIIKSKTDGKAKCDPLCSLKIEKGDDSIEFAVEKRGYVRDEKAFFLVARVNGGDKYFSRGYFTSRGGHQTAFAVTHDEPRGMSIQQGLFIEMRGLVSRLRKDAGSDFLDALLKEFEAMTVKVQVVNPEQDDAAADADATLNEESIGRLELRGKEKKTDEEIKERIDSICKPEPVEDIVDKSFAESVGDKAEKPDDDHDLYCAMRSIQVFEVS